jgi:aryl carrier-like protein
MIDELIDESTIRSSKIQFIFEESIRFGIDSIVVLSEVKNFRKAVCRCRFDDDHVDEQIENLLHEEFNK